MPVDTKRITGPEITTPYRLFSANNVKNYDQLRADVFSEDGNRKDERKLDEIRDIFARVGVISQAKGSAYVEMGNTKVVSSVFEPREIPKQTEFSYNGELFCEFKYAPFSCTNRVQLQPGGEEREMAASIRRALEPAVLRHLFENFQIDIFVYVIENDGSVLATAINAAGLALIDAEIPMYDIITSVGVGIQGNEIFLDPNNAEEELCLYSKPSGKDTETDHGVAVIAQLPILQQVTEFWQHGALTLDKTLSMVETVNPGCRQIYEEFRSLFTRKVNLFLHQKKVEDQNKNNGVVNSEQSRQDL